MPRKGVDLLLTAFARAFPDGAGARLVIKTAPGAVPGTPPPSVQVMTDDLTEVALLDLYAAADAMVLPTRGEGYNLPAAEALAAGLTLIVTGHGGHMDFVADAPAGAVRLVAYTLQPSASHLASFGSLWAEPDVDDLVRALQEVAGRPRIVRGYDWPMPDIAGLIAAAGADALLTAPRNARPAVWITPWGVRCGVAEYARQLVAAMPEPVTILADTRADAGAGVHPVWTTGADLALPALATAIQQQDPRIVVIQHHPALIGWTALPGLLAAPALVGRVVCVVLHNTREIAGHNDVTRGLIVGALARMSRVVMHTLADMNGLSALGLRDNIILIPHGAGSVAPGPAIRALVTTRPVTIGSTGFFMPHKGIGRLIEALAILRRTWPRARLILANAANPDPASLAEIAACQALAAQLSLTTAVTFQTDFLDPGAARALLQTCDLIALPYQATTEASSAAMRTALTAGVPVAVTPLPLFDEAADAVLRLPGLTPEAIAAGLDTFLRDQAGRQAAVDAAGAWLASRAWPVVAAQMDGMLQGLDASGVVVRA